MISSFSSKIMMEVDHISYIFGSFSRRRQSREVGQSKRRSINTLTISHDRSKSDPHTSNIVETLESRTKSLCIAKQSDDKFKCPMCKKHFIEPRVLPCLHTFCTRCLHEIESNEHNHDEENEYLDNAKHNSKTYSSLKYKEIEFESDILSNSMEEKPTDGFILCLICGVRSILPSGGVSNLPPNYLLQHRMILATLNSSSTHILCDLCSDDITAIFRCSECAISMCKICCDMHRRQRSYAQHEVLHLEEARKKGINRVQRLVMCTNHPEQELSLFCSTCCQVICHECTSGFHKGHTADLASRAAKSFTTNLKEALEKVRSISKQASRASARLQANSKKVQNRCNQVQEEVEKFMTSYIRLVEEHRKKLDNEINHAKEEKLQTIEKHQMEMEKRIKDIKDIVLFTDELLSEGTDVELLSFVKTISNKLEKYENLDQFKSTDALDNLHFLPKETVNYSDSLCPLYGAVSTQTVSPKHCVLNQEGLQHLRVGRRVEVLLEARDCNNTPLQRGGDNVTVELRQRDGGVSRLLLAHVEDKRNGTYNIWFIPDVSGKLFLSVKVKSQPIKNGPFTIFIQTTRPHHGTYHCCSFCSSGGSKEAACGCNGKMPGGYKGCGHGHDGHPGKRHWSCCGNILEHSECVRTNSGHYQFTL